jgi:hypothetical protein
VLDSAEHFHELAEMIAHRFADLETPDQARVVNAFRANSSESHARERLGPDASNDVVARYCRQCLRQWFAVLGKPWRVPRSRAAIRKTLEVLGAGTFASAARTIASRLVARGHFEFRDLA